MTRREIAPPRSRFKPWVVRLVFFVIGRALQAISRLDTAVRREVEAWPDGFTFVQQVLPDGPRMALVKERSGRLRYLGSRLRADEADLVIAFKNLTSAYLVLSLKLGTAQAYAEHRISVRGPIHQVMSVTRCLNELSVYLFPRSMAARLVKRAPNIPTSKRYAYRAFLYGVGIPLGL